MNHQRIMTVAGAISQLGYEGITQFDSAEPEYDTIVYALDRFQSAPNVGLLFVLAATQDYQLNGDAQRFWNTLRNTLAQRDQLDSRKAVNSAMADFLDEPVNSRLREQKRDRIIRMIENGFDEWFIEAYPPDDPITVWEKIADSLETSMSKKTVVFAVKVYDIFHLIDNGAYVALPTDVPVPCDVQVKRVAKAAGIVDKDDKETVMNAWARVMEQVNEAIDRPVSMLRIDSIIWQAGQIISDHGDQGEQSREALKEYFAEVGLAAEERKQLAEEFTVALEN